MSLSPVISIDHSSFRKRAGVALFAALVAFLTYASVYAYRKPFSVALFDGIKFRGVSYQTLLIISQVIGYMLSKFYGIRFIAELKKVGRWKTAAILISISWLALFIFAIVPPPYGMICLLINGFALGFMWGIVFSYIEGRRATDFIGSVMAISFIFAGGFTRSVAKWLMVEWNVSEFWMPFMTGLIFVLPLAIFIFLLERMPEPDDSDVRDRTARIPMRKEERKNFLKKFGIGLILITVSYLFLTVMRDLRDNYMSNLWTELGYGNNYSIFTKTEATTSLLILLVIGMMVLVIRNIIALRVVHFIIAVGFITAAVSSLLFINGKIGGALWMQLTGLGLYLGYIPFNCVFFERLIASFRIKGNAGFLIYFADAFGYLGSVLVMLSKELLDINMSWTNFYSDGVIIGCLFGLVGTIVSFNYFNFKYKASNGK
jgi:MFS family permease